VGGITQAGKTIDSALRVYSDDREELSRLAEDPSLCFAEVLDRYGVEYTISEGSRGRFAPVVLIPRERFNLTPPISPERFFSEVNAALDFTPTEGAGAFMAGKFRIPSEDEPIKIFWMFALDIGRYVADVRSRKGRR
jgi:hypothetical protein